jgi:AraC-like DNA-binding protein
MQEAVRLLTTTDLTTKEICARVGYRDINHFYKVFRREQGTTPTAVRKKRK